MACSADSALAKKCLDMAKMRADTLLKRVEEQVRGVVTLDHKVCIDRIIRSARVLSLSTSQAVDDDGSLLVGVLLLRSWPAPKPCVRTCVQQWLLLLLLLLDL
jgi:hypothetical protein